MRPLGVDEMTKEDEAFRLYLEENGWDTSQMGIHGSETAFSTDSAEKVDEKVDVKDVEV